jgi:hypothetical protein
MRQQIVVPVVVGNARSSEVRVSRVGDFASKGPMTQMNPTEASFLWIRIDQGPLRRVFWRIGVLVLHDANEIGHTFMTHPIIV